jgi:hypothetical protein
MLLEHPLDDDSVASLMAVGMALLAPIGWPLLLAIVAGVGGFAVGALAGSLPGATGIPDPAIGRGARSACALVIALALAPYALDAVWCFWQVGDLAWTAGSSTWEDLTLVAPGRELEALVAMASVLTWPLVVVGWAWAAVVAGRGSPSPADVRSEPAAWLCAAMMAGGVVFDLGRKQLVAKEQLFRILGMIEVVPDDQPLGQLWFALALTLTAVLVAVGLRFRRDGPVAAPAPVPMLVSAWVVGAGLYALLALWSAAGLVWAFDLPPLWADPPGVQGAREMLERYHQRVYYASFTTPGRLGIAGFAAALGGILHDAWRRR